MDMVDINELVTGIGITIIGALILGIPKVLVKYMNKKKVPKYIVKDSTDIKYVQFKQILKVNNQALLGFLLSLIISIPINNYIISINQFIPLQMMYWICVFLIYSIIISSILFTSYNRVILKNILTYIHVLYIMGMTLYISDLHKKMIAVTLIFLAIWFCISISMGIYTIVYSLKNERKRVTHIQFIDYDNIVNEILVENVKYIGDRVKIYCSNENKVRVLKRADIKEENIKY